MAPKQGSGIKRKVGPLPLWGWAATGGGAFLVYRYIKARRAAGAALAASGTTGGTSIPSGTIQTSGSTTGVSFTNTAQWEQAALSFLTGNGLSPSDAFNAINSWLLGTCVSTKAYNALAQALVSPSVGLPPGFSSFPTLSVCPAPPQNPGSGGGGSTTQTQTQTQTTKAAPVYPGISGLHLNMAPGEQVVAQAWDAAANEFIVLTNIGGIYDVAPSGGPGSVFYGSYLGLPSNLRQGTRSFVSLEVLPDGTYVAISNTGESYHFVPGTPQV